jgi:hypothetical protein
MSWTVASSGGKSELREYVLKYFAPLLAHNVESPYKEEYQGARDGILVFIESLPDGPTYSIAGHGATFMYKIDDADKTGGLVALEIKSVVER